MRRAVAVLVLVLASGLAGALPAQEPVRVRRAAGPPPKLTMSVDSIVVPLGRRDGGSPLVEVTIDGRGPFSFILDTGASGSVLSKALADSLKLPVLGEARVGSPVAGGTPQPGTIVSIGRLEIGGARLEGMTMVAMELGFGGRGPGIQGVLSPFAFHGAVVTFDFAASQVVVRRGALPAPDGRDVFGWDSTERLPTLPVDLPGGGHVDAHLDTGSPMTLGLPTSWIERLPLAAKPESAGVARTVDRSFTRLSARLQGAATVGRHRLADPEITFAEPIRTGNVGMGFLAGFRVSVDPANRRLRLDPTPPGAAKAPRPKRYGVQFRGLEGDTLDVAGVDSGSPAAAAGVRAGDRVVAFNGKPLAGLESAARIAALQGTPLVLTVRRDGATREIRMTLE